MKHSKPVHPVPKGLKPFKPGPDRRRNMGGNLNAALQSYEVRLKNAAANKLLPEDFALILAEEVRHHLKGAREFWGKYIIGEPTQKHEHSGGLNLSFTAADIFKAKEKAKEELGKN